jgi:hypothetical protein
MGNCDFCSGTGEVVGVVGMVSLQFGLFEDEEEAVHTGGRTREEDLQREGHADDVLHQGAVSLAQAERSDRR